MWGLPVDFVSNSLTNQLGVFEIFSPAYKADVVEEG
jgi:hypothetical protein